MSNTVKDSIDFLALLILYLLVFFRRWRRKGRDKLLVHTAMYVYIAFVLYFTLMPIITSLPSLLNHPYKPMYMEPFGDYFAGRGDTVRQILLNVLLMIPFGFLLPVIKKRGLLICLLWTFLFSLCIELVQPLMSASRASDVTDLITNTVGGMVGFLLYKLFRPMLEAVLVRLNPDRSADLQ